MAATPDQMAATFFDFVLRHGYRRAAVEDVARQLRVSKKTIYDHFPSKEALHARALELWAEGQRTRVAARLTATDPLDRLDQIMAIAFADARAGFAAQAAPDHIEPVDIVYETNERVFAPMVCELIIEANAREECAVRDPALMARFCIAIGTEAVRALRDDPDSRADITAQEAVRRLIEAPVTS